MRALLVVNPKATTTSDRIRDVLVRALRSEVDLEVTYTRRRGDAAAQVQKAMDRGLDVVVTLGGDGTVNEAVNGMLANGPSPEVPALAVVPGGSTNVFARALGLPRDWAEGAGVILEALREGRRRTVNLGRADGRYFTFGAGLGLDAEVIRRVERARLRGRTSTPLLYFRSFTSQYLFDTDRGNPALTLQLPGEPAETGLASAVVQNTSPWTYIGDRSVDACPDASFETGLDVMALRGLGVPATIRTVTQLVLSVRAEPGSGAGVHGRHVLRLHDLDEFTINASRPTAFQLDGDYLGERRSVHFTAVRQALRVVC
jgi:diacylglycerol kinase family enzyme